MGSQPGSGSTFSFTLPLYSLARFLLPVIAHQGRLREALVLVRVELTPLPQSLRGSWKETCARCLELLRRCVYVDKDLVLPPLAASGPVETFFVVASTDMERVGIMMDRIRGQVGALPQLKASGTLRVAAEPIPVPPSDDPSTLEQQVWGVADYVTAIIQRGLGSGHNFSEKENQEHAY